MPFEPQKHKNLELILIPARGLKVTLFNYVKVFPHFGTDWTWKNLSSCENSLLSRGWAQQRTRICAKWKKSSWTNAYASRFQCARFFKKIFLSFDLILRHLHQTSQFQPKRLSVRNPQIVDGNFPEKFGHWSRSIENQGLQNDAIKQMITAVQPLLDQMYEKHSRTCFAGGGSYKKPFDFEHSL